MVAVLLLLVVPVGSATEAQPRLNEPVFRGQANATNDVTTLTGSVAGGASLVLDNQAPGKPALELRVVSGAPLTVNSRVRVRRLNADLLDGNHATAFALSGHTHDGVYLPVNGVAADAGLLDGMDSSVFALVSHTHAFGSLTNLPAGLADGDDDILGGLDCPAGQIPKRNPSDTAWECAEDQNPTDADTLDGLHAVAFAASGHDHDASYVSLVNTPTEGNFPVMTAGGELGDSAWGPSSFAPFLHNHAGMYLPLGATAADSAKLGGLAATAFSQTSHLHDALYVSLVNTPTEGNFPVMTAGGGLGDSAWGPASFAPAIHSHDGTYLPINGTAANCSLLDGHGSDFFAPAAHDHDADYLGIGATAADSDQIDAMDANELLRAATGVTGDAPDANGDAVTVSITAPQTGFLVISGSLEASGVSDDFGCRLSLDAAAIPMSDRSTSLQGLAICSTDAMVPVAAGAHTVALATFGRDTAVFGNATVWVIYVPFGATG